MPPPPPSSQFRSHCPERSQDTYELRVPIPPALCPRRRPAGVCRGAPWALQAARPGGRRQDVETTREVALRLNAVAAYSRRCEYATHFSRGGTETTGRLGPLLGLLRGLLRGPFTSTKGRQVAVERAKALPVGGGLSFTCPRLKFCPCETRKTTPVSGPRAHRD